LGDLQTIRIGSRHTATYVAGISGTTTYTGNFQVVHFDDTGKLHVTLAVQLVLWGKLYPENATTDTCGLTLNTLHKNRACDYIGQC
jgi:hypothetical protein